MHPLRGAAALPVFLALVFTGVARADEPYARSRDYDLQNARIALRFDLDQHKVIGEVTHTLAALRDGLTRFSFDSVGLTISSVTINAKPAKFETNSTQLLVDLSRPAKRGEKFEVAIHYQGQPAKGLYFVLPDKNYPDRPKEVWTQGEAEDTRYYVPIYDYPNDRTATEMILTVPADWLTVSNGRLVSVTPAAGGMKTWTWRQSLPVSTYLISLVAGEFQESKQTWRRIPVDYYVPRGDADRIDVTFERTRKMLDFFSEKLGVPYPWDQYAQAAVDDFVVGGMENVSATTLTSQGLVNPQLASESYLRADPLISHEMAHQWFGDLVTCKDWANLWLNEGFATYLEILWEEHEYGPDTAAYSLWRNRNSWMSSARLFPVPIVTRNFSDSVEYAGNVYTKGGWALHMLREQLGDAAFFHGLQHYLEVNRLKNVVSADLAKGIEEATGTNVDEFFNQWIYGAGAPRFKVRNTYDAAAKQVKLQVQQTQKVEGRVGLFRVPIEVAITTQGGEKDFPITVSKAEESFTFSVDGPPLVVLFDKGGKILKSVDFEKSPAEWVYQLQTAQAVPDRADAARALGEIKDNEAVVAALGEAALRDRFWGVRVEVLRALGRIGGTSAEQQILAALANDQPWVRQVAVEQLGRFKDDPALVARLQTISREDKAYHVRAAALAGLAELKAPDALGWLEAATKTDSPDDLLRRAALRAMATLGDDKAVPTLLEWSAIGKPFGARTAAIFSLGRLDKKNKDVENRLIGYLNEPYNDVRGATIFALGERGDPAAIAPLEALLKSGNLAIGHAPFLESQIERLKHPGGAPRGPQAGEEQAARGATNEQILERLDRLERQMTDLGEQLKRIEASLAASKK